MKLLAGDWKAGTDVLVKRSLTGRWKELLLSRGFLRTDRVPMGEIASCTLVTQENQTSILGKVGWGAVGAVALGPLGLLAGVIGGGNHSHRVVVFETADGRKAMVRCSAAEAEALLAASFDHQLAGQG
ncbi:hypothetical protein XM25_07977 [Devosia sp. H5989]|nr:hypothetical protein XM25_07977 [Devosia sp. H5989]